MTPILVRHNRKYGIDHTGTLPIILFFAVKKHLENIGKK
jgi:hypothetical protein